MGDYFFELISYVILVFTGIFPIANPFSTAPVFLALTINNSKKERNRIAAKASIYMAIILLLFLCVGALILGFFNISIPGLRIAGGLIIIVTGIKMLFPDTNRTNEVHLPSENENIAFTPLAMPLLSGPGSISVVLSMSDRVSSAHSTKEMLIGYCVVALGIILTVFACWAVLRSSAKISRFMGKSGIDVLTRMMAFFLVAIGVEFFLGGISEYINNARFTTMV
ncbi:MarC family NAAT transporter [Desulfobacter postgatei]|uniref:UPF0056 membrane protein n=1 Tax=Desulfobacter postgatei 2ac9 TaxID=879212 RepID=I5B197_9BACT|nr:MarC family NAAT transporter [Desulfobacter postgatei]EIM63260.1 membrane protein, MarC family [Desulfobacter postgatei 2ac9]